ncbi:MAG: peptidase S41, partial [Bacteroidota bacterium]
MTHPKYKWRHYAVLPLLLIGLLAGSQLQNKYFKVSKNLEIFAGILKELEGHYVDEVDTDAIVKTGINAMLQSLDPYTNFFSE